MRKRAAKRLDTLVATLGLLLPAWLLFAAAIALNHAASLVLFLLGNTIAMTAICHVAGFGREARFTTSLARRGLVYFVQLTAWTFATCLFAAPVWWLSRDGSLAAALTLSATSMVGLLALWRIWPMFTLPFLWDDAYPTDDENGSWLSAALGRSFVFATHLTHERALFLRYGLLATLCVVVLTIGMLLLSTLGGYVTGEIRTGAIVVYGLVLAPLLHTLLINRGCRALLTGRCKAGRADTAAATVIDSVGDGDQQHAELPAGISRNELDATLLCAVQSRQMNLALAALDRGADPNAMPGPDRRDQRNPIAIAVTLPDLRLLRALIAKGVDVNRAFAGGMTPLIAATRDSYQGRPDAVTTLLANGADARIGDADANTPLHHAARCAEPTVAALLVDAGADLDAINIESMTPLAIACAHGNHAVAGFLLERGAHADLSSARPALLHAASVSDDDPTAVRLLLKRKANADAVDEDGRSALLVAAAEGHVRIVDTLLNGGADVDRTAVDGTCALMEAARVGAVAVIHALGKRKVNLDAVDNRGRSALAIACQSREAGEETVRALLSLGSDRDLRDVDGKRAIDHAIAAGRWHIVALLDPAYALPSNLAGAHASDVTASADHLLDALRFGHWNVADEFVGIIAEWPPSALASMYFELRGAEDDLARCWLLNHGLDGAAALGDDRTLVDALRDELPASAHALDELVARGVAVNGAGLLASVYGLAARGAAADSMQPLVDRLMRAGADACGTSPARQTLLHLAAAYADRSRVEWLLEIGINPNARDARGDTALHLACKSSSANAAAIVRCLILAGADPEISTANGETALGLALARNERDVAHWLGWSHWRLPGRRLRGSDLPAAATAGDRDAVERLIELGLPIDSEDEHGATALLRAVGAGHAALVVQLLEAGAEVAHLAPSGMHCLAAAVSARRGAIVRTLLGHGVPPNLPLPGGSTALTIATGLGDAASAQALIEAGADANVTDAQGLTPLHAAARYAFDGADANAARALLEMLIRAGAKLDARNEAGQDALLILLGASAPPGTRCDAERLRRLAELLLQHGATFDAQDRRGVGPLHACALHGLYGCTRLLKAHGAPTDQVDGFGRSAADVAALLGYAEVAAELDATRAALPSVRQTLRRPARASD